MAYICMGQRPLPALRDLTHDGRWSTYDVSVLKKMGGKMCTDRTPSKATITNKTRPAGSFSSSQPGGAPCRPGVLCICLFSTHPHPQQAGPKISSWLNARQKMAIASLCTNQSVPNQWTLTFAPWRGCTVKKVSDFPVPSRDVTYQILPGRE